MRPDPQFALEGDWRKTMPSTSDLKHAACDAVDAMRAELIGMAQLGRMDKAHQEAELFMVSNPHFTISCWAAFQPFATRPCASILSMDIARLDYPIEAYPLPDLV
jgi:hypothetical protein